MRESLPSVPDAYVTMPAVVMYGMLPGDGSRVSHKLDPGVSGSGAQQLYDPLRIDLSTVSVIVAISGTALADLPSLGVELYPTRFSSLERRGSGGWLWRFLDPQMTGSKVDVAQVVDMNGAGQGHALKGAPVQRVVIGWVILAPIVMSVEGGGIIGSIPSGGKIGSSTASSLDASPIIIFSTISPFH
ncbi:hypothetical protein Tco_0230847 [Tanacetum coccineum]